VRVWFSFETDSASGLKSGQRGVFGLRRKVRITVSLAGLVAIAAAAALIVFAAVFVLANLLLPVYSIKFDPGSVSAENVIKFEQVRSILKNDFYQDVDENVLLEGAVRGMADSLNDSYTVYYTKEQMQKLIEISTRSYESYVGIGVTVFMDTDGLLTVLEPFDGSPALRAGILKGDKILAVDGQDVTGIKDEDIIVNMIKGPENTKVRITVYRPSEYREIDFTVDREKINAVLNIRSDVLDGDIGYIRIMSFNDSNINKLFREHLDRLLDRNIKGLIIDLRDNLGGYYDQVVKIADRLLPEGIIVYTEDRDKNRKTEYSDPEELEIPLAVLVNSNSASASEVLAGAIKDHKKGTLIGTTTFGKGVVQEVKYLNDGSGIKVTIAHYFTPDGTSIHGVGIKPDIEIGTGDRYERTPVSQIPRNEDIQLKKALEILNKNNISP